jgi:hypothetical protein
MPPRKPVVIESLSQGRWTRIGEFSATRAKKLSLLLRREGQIVRTDAEVPVKGRIGWATASNDTQLGTVDSIDIFVLAKTGDGAPGRWVLYARLPGCDGKPTYTDTEAEAKASAETILDAFVWRMGVSTR